MHFFKSAYERSTVWNHKKGYDAVKLVMEDGLRECCWVGGGRRVRNDFECMLDGDDKRTHTLTRRMDDIHSCLITRCVCVSSIVSNQMTMRCQGFGLVELRVGEGGGEEKAGNLDSI